MMIKIFKNWSIGVSCYLIALCYSLKSYTKIQICSTHLYTSGENRMSCPITKQGSTLEKKPWGQLAPKFLDLVASTDFLVAKNFWPFGLKTFT